MASDQQQSLVPGALVQWEHIKAYGVIASNDGQMIHVNWDDAGHPPQFSASDPPLLRVDFVGRPVQRKSTGQNVAVLGPVAAAAPTWRCQIFSSTGVAITANVPEADLRPLAMTDPLERFRAGEIGSTKRYLLRQVAQQYRMQNLQDDLVSLGQSQVDIQPHQVSVVHKVISNYPHRFLLCDEVGLGKTIEAGMVLKELRARGGAQRVLAIVPPNLVRQWQFEMRTKFNEPFAVLNTATVNNLRANGYQGNPFAHPDYSNALCSSKWVSNRRWRDLCTEAYWDLIILDEAHHARSYPDGTTTALYRLVRDLAPEEHPQRMMLFLTATPMQLHTHELYSLVEILDPTLFPSEEDFEQHRRATPGLSRLVESLSHRVFPVPGQDEEETAQTVEQVAQWLEMDAREVRDSLSAGQDELQKIADRLADKHRLSEVLIRNRKALVGGFMPRTAFRWEVDLSPEERIALQAVEDYVRFGYQFAADTNANAIGFLMVIFQKLAASSIAAIRQSLLKRREKVLAKSAAGNASPADMEEMLDDDSNASDVVEMGGTIADRTSEELLLLDNAIAALNDVGENDSKARVLVDRLEGLFQEQPDEKVIVFTQFRETQRHLEELFTGRGWEVNVFHGEMNADAKDRAIEQFKKNSGSQVLISTEAGGEGRNLQFCHFLVNYDLPWNPMKVEQRIGRVDRIGQTQPISIFNLWVKDTVEERVLDILENRIRLFEETVGGLDPILGDAENIESDIQKIMSAAADNLEAVLADFDRQTEEKISASREAGLLLGDFIMDTKSFRREIAERISGQTSPVDNDYFEKFIGQLLADVKTHIEKSGDTYELSFHGDFLEDYRRQLFVGGPRMKAVLRPDRRADAEDVEFMVFGHKVVDTIVSQVLGEDYEGATGTRVLAADGDLPAMKGWLFQYQFTTSGIRDTENLETVFVSDDGEVNEEIGRLLVQRAYRFDKEESIVWEQIPSNLDQIEPQASNFASAKQQALQHEAEAQAAGRIEREISRLGDFYDYKELAAKDKVEATRTTLARIQESGTEGQRQILPAWEANLRRDEGISANLAEERRRRLKEAEQHRYPQVSWALKSLGRIEVVGPS